MMTNTTPAAPSDAAAFSDSELFAFAHETRKETAKRGAWAALKMYEELADELIRRGLFEEFQQELDRNFKESR